MGRGRIKRGVRERWEEGKGEIRRGTVRRGVRGSCEEGNEEGGGGFEEEKESVLARQCKPRGAKDVNCMWQILCSSIPWLGSSIGWYRTVLVIVCSCAPECSTERSGARAKGRE